MKIATKPANEAQRLEELYQYEILDTPPDEDFNEVVALASSICQTPLSYISLIDAERQWFKAGLTPGQGETTREVSFCSHTILQEDILEIGDASRDERFFDNPFVTSNPHIRFYAGVPLISPKGFCLGTLCVTDRIPKNLTNEQRQALRFLGKQVMKLLELHRQNRELKKGVLAEQSLRKELERVTKMQQTMISIIAHDVRGPLGSIKAVVDSFSDHTLDMGEVLQLMPIASRQLDGALDLVNNVVDWGLLQVRQGSIQRTPFTLNSLIAGIVTLAEERVSTKKNVLINFIDPQMQVVSDPHTLQFVLRNLLDNAIKFTYNGIITVSAAGRGKHFSLLVTDTGVGMEGRVREQLFSSGTKHSSKGTGDEKGSGLGLLLCKQFIDRLGGAITVTSQPNEGTKVLLEFI